MKKECRDGYGHSGFWCGPSYNCWLDPRTEGERQAEEAKKEKPEFNEAHSRADFESMAAIVYPGALSAGRNKTFGTYVNCNLEKRWQGWKACDEFRAGIVPTRQRGKS